MKMNVIIILSLLLKLAVSGIPNADDKLHIYGLPVGQGDCTVIQCPKANGGPTKGVVTIIDAGASNSKGIDGKGIVDFLKGTELNFVVLTHSHKDHINYMDTILDYSQKGITVYHSCDWSTYKNHVKSKYASPKEIKSCSSINDCANLVQELSPCPNVDAKLSFVASAVGKCKGYPNQDSIISKITYAGIYTLITGDFELPPKDMKTFLQKAGADLDSHIYRLSHHGAWNGLANQEEFLDAVDAEVVFSSSGYRYNHPRCEVYDYYNAILPDNVAEHPYTCFAPNKVIKNVNTKKAIYVTSLIWEKSPGTWVKSFYLVHLIIDKNVDVVKVGFDYIGDDTL